MFCIFYLWYMLSVIPYNAIVVYQIWRNYKVDSTERSWAETISRHPEKNALGQASDDHPFFFIFSVHTRWYWRAWPIGSSRCTDSDLREELQSLMRMDWCHTEELTSGGRIWVSLSAAKEGGGVRFNEESHLCFTLSAHQSHIRGLKGAMNSSSSNTHKLYSFRAPFLAVQYLRYRNSWLDWTFQSWLIGRHSWSLW